MNRFTFQIETVYSAKRPQDLDCVGLLERLKMAFDGPVPAPVRFGKRKGFRPAQPFQA